MNATEKPKEFAALWSLHARGIYTYILTLVGNWADADDVFQETSTTIWAKMEQFQHDRDFGAWARGIAHFKVLSHSQVRRPLDHFSEHFFEAVKADYEELGEELEERHAALHECLQKLTVQDRKLVECRYYGNHPTKQVATEVGRSVVGVYKALRRIRESLFDCIQRRIAREGRS